MIRNNNQYSFSTTVIVIVVAIGFLLQILLGNVDFDLLRAPVNLFIGGVIILLLIAFAFFRDTPVYQWFSGIPFSVTLLTAILIFCLFMGLIPQAPVITDTGKEIYTMLGLRQITSSWPFVLLYLVLLLSLGALIIRRLLSFKLKDIAFHFNHIGLWILLFSAGLGAADHKQYSVYVSEGESTSYGSLNNTVYPLPFSIHLYDFDIEEYPLEAGETQAKPQSYMSYVELTLENNEKTQARIEVNNALNIGAWSIYQYGYDYEAGKASTYSILQAVYDPWLPFVYTGICLLAAGAVGIMIRRNNKRWNYKQWITLFAFIAGMLTVFLLLYPQIRSSRLMPALQSHWFIPHVASYIISYALLGAATIISFILMWKQKKGVPNENWYKFMDTLIFIGFGLLILGMLMGAVWGKEAWGHYWNWDPKETWAFITVLSYLLYIHLRLRQDYRKYLLYLLVIAFILLLITWIGVNYLPSAQHSIHVY